MSYTLRGYRGPARPRMSTGDRLRVLFFGAFVVLFLVFAGISLSAYLHTETMTCTVTDKDRTTNSDGDSDACIYTSDCGTLQVADSLIDGHWSSADTYASIEPGETYTFDTRGRRIPLFSMFPNVIEVK